MADQKVSNERRKELEQLDPFQENLIKGMAYIKEYKKQLIMIAGAVILVIVVFSGIMYSFKKAENNAATLVSKALTAYEKINDPEKGYLEVQDDFQTIFSEYTNTSAGKLAKVEFAKICYAASKFDQSFNFYKDAYENYKHDALMENFLLVSLGHVSLARKEMDRAKKYFLQVMEGETDLLKDEAGFALAMLEESAGNSSGSKKMYEKIVSDYENSIYHPIAKSKLSEIE